MDPTLLRCFTEAGVREGIITILLEDELDTMELIDKTSDELFKACGIKGGQIVRLRNGVQMMKDGKNEEDTSSMGSSLLLPPMALDINSTPPLPSMASDTNSTPARIDHKKPIAFSINEQPRSNKNWLGSFILPNLYSPSVTDALNAGQMPSSVRNEFTRDICAAIRVFTMSPTKSEREHVAMMVTKEFPFLADAMGTGIGSWQTAFKYRFKNLRKTKGCTKQLAYADKLATKEPELKRKKFTSEIPQLDDGETDETQREHLQALKKEMQKTSNKNQSLIKELMSITFNYRRKEILTKLMKVEDMINSFPALQLVSEIKSEFSRVTGINTKCMTDSLTKLSPNILKMAATRKLNIIAVMEDLITDDSDKKSEFEGTASVIALTQLMKDKGGEDAVLKICTENESIDKQIETSVFPRLVGSGEMDDISPLYLAAEGRIVAKLSGTSVTMPMALVLLMGVYYIFNIEYNPKAKNVFVFLEAKLLQNDGEAKKRVSVQKFLKDLLL